MAGPQEPLMLRSWCVETAVRVRGPLVGKDHSDERGRSYAVCSGQSETIRRATTENERGSRLARRSELTVYSHGASTISDEKECEICHRYMFMSIKGAVLFVNTP